MKLDRIKPATLVWLITGLVGLVAVGAVAFALADGRSASRGEARQAEEVSICERGNIVRGLLILQSRDYADREQERRIRAVAPLIDCVAAIQDDAPDTPLAPEVVDEFLAILMERQTPHRLPGDPPRYAK